MSFLQKRLSTHNAAVTLLFILGLPCALTHNINALFKKKATQQTPHDRQEKPNSLPKAGSTKRTMLTICPPQFTVREFDLSDKIPGLSKKQIDDHLTLYKGYVNKYNQISHDLLSVSRKDTNNRTFSCFRSLKIAQTYAENGSILHELYFENVGTAPQKIGPLTLNLLIKNFGSLNAFKQDFFDCAGSSRGWVLIAYSLYDKNVRSYILEEHNQTVPLMTIPLLVLDVYEHAYMIDFGIDRMSYVQLFYDHINWNVVEERVKKYVPGLQDDQR